MSRISSKQIVSGSVLDRLISPDDKPLLNKITSPPQRDLKQTLCRDLENLLNTRWRCQSWPPELAELDRSLLGYGIPDYGAASSSGSAAREEFRRVVEKAIGNFELRFSPATVKVTIANASESGAPMLRWHIDAVLRTEAAVEPVSFEAALDMATAAFRVTSVSSVTRVA